MSEPLTERYLDNFLADAKSACADGKHINVWADAYAEEVPQLVAEVRRLQQENDRMAVLVAYGYKSHLYEVAEFLGFQWREPGPLRLMPLDQIEAASTLVRDAIMQAALHGRALVEKGGDDGK